MIPFTNTKTFRAALAIASVAAIATGCRSHERTAYYHSTTPYAVGAADTSIGYQTSTTARESDNATRIAQRRVDETDTGPGTPKGDATAADPAETSTQGAGSRALVGEQKTGHFEDLYHPGTTVKR